MCKYTSGYLYLNKCFMLHRDLQISRSNQSLTSFSLNSCHYCLQYTSTDASDDWIVLEEYDVSKSGLINVVPPTEMAKVKIIPLESLEDSAEFFYFNVDFYACQQSKDTMFCSFSL